MARYEITNVSKSENSLDHITHVSGPDLGTLSLESLVRSMRAGDTYYTRFGLDDIELRIVDATPPYVRTSNNDVRADHLLALPPCPGSKYGVPLEGASIFPG